MPSLVTTPASPPAHGPYGAAHPLGDPTFRATLVRALRRRLPEDDAEDIVQSAFVEAVAAGKADDDPVLLKRWLAAVARNKAIDHLRKRREVLAGETPDIADARVHESDELLRWAEREMPSGEGAEETLEWMIREAEGETLESIAKESQVPAARVRKRVSRMREHFRKRWSLYAAALAALCVAALLGKRFLASEPTPPIAKDEPSAPLPAPSPLELARDLRRRAFVACNEGNPRRCLDLFDEAKQLDDAGDGARDVQEARSAAMRTLSPPAPSTTMAPPAPSAPPPRDGGVRPPSSAAPTTPLPSGGS